VATAALQSNIVTLVMAALPALPTPAAELPTSILTLARPVLSTVT